MSDEEILAWITNLERIYGADKVYNAIKDEIAQRSQTALEHEVQFLAEVPLKKALAQLNDLRSRSTSTSVTQTPAPSSSNASPKGSGSGLSASVGTTKRRK